MSYSCHTLHSPSRNEDATATKKMMKIEKKKLIHSLTFTPKYTYYTLTHSNLQQTIISIKQTKK